MLMWSPLKVGSTCQTPGLTDDRASFSGSNVRLGSVNGAVAEMVLTSPSLSNHLLVTLKPPSVVAVFFPIFVAPFAKNADMRSFGL